MLIFAQLELQPLPPAFTCSLSPSLHPTCLVSPSMWYSTKTVLTPQMPQCHRLWQRADSFPASLFVMPPHVPAATLSRERGKGVGPWVGGLSAIN